MKSLKFVRCNRNLTSGATFKNFEPVVGAASAGQTTKVVGHKNVTEAGVFDAIFEHCDTEDEGLPNAGAIEGGKNDKDDWVAAWMGGSRKSQKVI
jgi:hypothetical protein